MSIDGLSDLGSGNEDDALHNRVANEERAAMATVPPNAEQDDREEDAPLLLIRMVYFIGETMQIVCRYIFYSSCIIRFIY